MDVSSGYLFVYGSLMSDFKHPMHQVLRRYSEKTDTGYFQGRLYLIDWYPGAVCSDSEEDRVWGEVYRVEAPEPLYTELDLYEGIPNRDSDENEYRRETISVCTRHSGILACQTYLYNWSLDTARCIADGRFESMDLS